MIGLDTQVVLRCARHRLLVARHVVIRMSPHPRMVGCGVVRYKVEHQFDATFGQLLAELRQCGRAAECTADGVGGDRETGAANIVLGQVRQSGFELAAPQWVTARDRASRGAGLPDAQQPDPVEAPFSEAIDRGVVDVGKSDLPAGLAGETP